MGAPDPSHSCGCGGKLRRPDEPSRAERAHHEVERQIDARSAGQRGVVVVVLVRGLTRDVCDPDARADQIEEEVGRDGTIGGRRHDHVE